MTGLHVLPHWPALRAAQASDARARLPFVIDGLVVGSVARAHLAPLAAWPEAIAIDAAAVRLVVPSPMRDGVLAQINARLRLQGLVMGWRDERFAVFDPTTRRVLAHIERAASRFWGTLTLAAHCSGYLADAAGRPTHLWIARRSASKATDPGLFDNLVGGGVPAGQTPHEALVREGWEEAGLTAAQMSLARPGRVIRLQGDIAEGLQFEDLHSYELALPAGTCPDNQDGEVERFDCLPIEQALALAASPTMTVDAALVTLDFALRHALLPAGEAAALAAAMAPLFVPPHLGDQMA